MALIIVSWLCKLVTMNFRDYKVVYKALAPIVEKRLELRAADEEPDERPASLTC